MSHLEGDVRRVLIERDAHSERPNRYIISLSVVVHAFEATIQNIILVVLAGIRDINDKQDDKGTTAQQERYNGQMGDTRSLIAKDPYHWDARLFVTFVSR